MSIKTLALVAVALAGVQASATAARALPIKLSTASATDAGIIQVRGGGMFGGSAMRSGASRFAGGFNQRRHITGTFRDRSRAEKWKSPITRKIAKRGTDCPFQRSIIVRRSERYHDSPLNQRHLARQLEALARRCGR
ncbi:MAG: hypothetical protein R3D27_10660 [Hyphomicrobiaceae bacterium]